MPSPAEHVRAAIADLEEQLEALRRVEVALNGGEESGDTPGRFDPDDASAIFRRRPGRPRQNQPFTPTARRTMKRTKNPGALKNPESLQRLLELVRKVGEPIAGPALLGAAREGLGPDVTINQLRDALKDLEGQGRVGRIGERAATRWFAVEEPTNGEAPPVKAVPRTNTRPLEDERTYEVLAGSAEPLGNSRLQDLLSASEHAVRGSLLRLEAAGRAARRTDAGRIRWGAIPPPEGGGPESDE